MYQHSFRCAYGSSDAERTILAWGASCGRWPFSQVRTQSTFDAHRLAPRERWLSANLCELKKKTYGYRGRGNNRGTASCPASPTLEGTLHSQPSSQAVTHRSSSRRSLRPYLVHLLAVLYPGRRNAVVKNCPDFGCRYYYTRRCSARELYAGVRPDGTLSAPNHVSVPRFQTLNRS